jgi:glycosyltransferase involved in cell wall biosynthesis
MYFSVVVPFLNEERYIEACIKSLLNQDFDYNQYELIFIDNGSTDRSKDIVTSYSDILYLKEPKQDPYLARNRGIKAARGRYIAFIDADCEASPNWLSIFYLGLSKSQACVALGKLTYPANSSLFLKCHQDYYDTKTALLVKALPKACSYGHAGNMVVATSLFKSLGLFTGMPIVGDTDIVHKYLQADKANNLAYFPDAVVTHLEVTDLGQLLGKLYNYGALSETYSRTGSYRPLTAKEKLLAFETCAKEYSYSYIRKSVLFCALFVGLCAFELGRYSKIFESVSSGYS